MKFSIFPILFLGTALAAAAPQDNKLVARHGFGCRGPCNPNGPGGGHPPPPPPPPPVPAYRRSVPVESSSAPRDDKIEDIVAQAFRA